MTDNSWKSRYSMSHTSPHPLSKRYHCPRFEYTLTHHWIVSPTPLCPLARPRPSFASVEMNLPKLHKQWPTDLLPQWNDTPPSLPNSSLLPAPTLTTSRGLSRPAMKRSAIYRLEQGMPTCRMTLSSTTDGLTPQSPHRKGGTCWQDGLRSSGVVKSLRERRRTPMS